MTTVSFYCNDSLKISHIPLHYHFSSTCLYSMLLLSDQRLQSEFPSRFYYLTWANMNLAKMLEIHKIFYRTFSKTFCSVGYPQFDFLWLKNKIPRVRLYIAKTYKIVLKRFLVFLREFWMPTKLLIKIFKLSRNFFRIFKYLAEWMKHASYKANYTLRLYSTKSKRLLSFCQILKLPLLLV